jgi:hypothetical protein
VDASAQILARYKCSIMATSGSGCCIGYAKSTTIRVASPMQLVVRMTARTRILVADDDVSCRELELLELTAVADLFADEAVK